MSFKPVTVFVCTLALIGCKPDPNEAANELFVSSQSLMSDYQQVIENAPDDLARQIELLGKVQENMTRIVEEFPGSDLAVQLSIGPVGSISPTQITDSLKALTTEQSCQFQLRECMLSEAFAEFSEVKDLETAIEGLTSLAILQDRQGSPDDVQATLSVIKMRLDKSRNSADATVYDSAAARAASTLALRGEYSSARGLISSIADAHKRALSMTKLALTMQEQNPNDLIEPQALMDQAFAVIASSGMPVTKCWLSKANVSFDARLENFGDVSSHIAKLKNDECASESLLAAARIAYRNEQYRATDMLLEQAVHRIVTANGIERPFWPLSRIAEFQVESNLPEWRTSFDQARKIAREEWAPNRPPYFRRLFEIARDAGDLELAKEVLDETMQQIKTTSSSGYTVATNEDHLPKIAMSHIELGQVDAGLALIDNNLKEPKAVQTRVFAAGNALADDNEKLANMLLDQAQTMTLAMQNPKERVRLLAMLASARLERGELAAAERLAQEAEPTLSMLPRFGLAHVDVATVLFRAGRVSEAMDILLRSNRDYSYVGLSMRVVSGVGSDTELDAMLGALREAKFSIPDPQLRTAFMAGTIQGWFFNSLEADS